MRSTLIITALLLTTLSANVFAEGKNKGDAGPILGTVNLISEPIVIVTLLQDASQKPSYLKKAEEFKRDADSLITEEERSLRIKQDLNSIERVIKSETMPTALKNETIKSIREGLEKVASRDVVDAAALDVRQIYAQEKLAEAQIRFAKEAVGRGLLKTAKRIGAVILMVDLAGRLLIWDGNTLPYALAYTGFPAEALLNILLKRGSSILKAADLEQQ